LDAGAGETAVWACERLVEIAAARKNAGNVMVKSEVFIKEKPDLKETPRNQPVGRQSPAPRLRNASAVDAHPANDP